MTRWFLILATLAMLGNTRRAEACEGGSKGIDGVIGLVIVGGGAYAGVTLGFAAADVFGSDHSAGYGVAETVIHAPIAVGAAVAGFGANSRNALGFAALMLLHGGLAAHGIYTIAHAGDRREPDKARRVARRPRAVLAPTLIPDGAGIGYAGTF